MSEIPNIVTKIMDLITSEGHQCCWFDLTKKQLQWCNKDKCQIIIDNDKMEEVNRKNEEFGQQLMQNGHTCVAYLESYPVQVCWCEQDTCNRGINVQNVTDINNKATM